ncbi:hypothetical protein H5410_037820 [Solanum commersonii]|uniref:peroxidase n=1 Tax=Solanum commersonii TaxID=4109 RepID=A0A9J5YBB4_SOLCO|nr:hypothetical protein H5410_037820 [Solanum commersonii]
MIYLIGFVQGCDGSVLLNFTPSTKNQTEKVVVPNQTLRGFSFIDGVKKAVEAECPGVVSCADIVALVARDSVVVTGGPYWKVPTGRRDGRISNASEALANIPPPTSNFSSLQMSFANKGLDLKDLSKNHYCYEQFSTRCTYYWSLSLPVIFITFTQFCKQDPSLDSKYAANLKMKKCKSINDNTTIVEMDPRSSSKFDLSYCQLVLKRKGLFQSDAALTTKSFINQLVQGSLKQFYAKFGLAMEKMGKIEVKTGSAGEIRKQCAAVNS